MNRIGKNICLWVWNRLRSEQHWSGIFPALLIIVSGIIGYHYASKQLDLLGESMSRVRRPIVAVESWQLDYGRPKWNLFIKNIGNAPVEMGYPRTAVLMLSPSEIYTCKPLEPRRGQRYDSAKTPSLVPPPRMYLRPNQEADLTMFTMGFYRAAYQTTVDSKNVIENDFALIAQKLDGKCVLFVEVSYLGGSDFALQVDTTYFWYDFIKGAYQDISYEIGGLSEIERIREYLEIGPEKRIVIRSDAYVIQQGFGGLSSSPNETVLMPRELPEDSLSTPN